MEEGKNREPGRADQAPGLPEDSEVTGITPDPRHVKEPRSNPTSSGRKKRSRADGRATSTNSENTIADKGSELWHSYLQDTILKEPMKPHHGHRPAQIRRIHPPVIAKNKGKWLYHEILKTGVLVHVPSPATRSSRSAAAARLMSTLLIREIAEIADKYRGGYVRWTTRNNIEFMLDDEKNSSS
jgi:hypothetical protein